MTVFLALFGAAWRRARERRALAFLVLFGGVAAVCCASLEFTEPDPKQALRSHLEDLAGRLRRRDSPASVVTLRRPPKVEARAPAAEDDLPLGLEHAAVADLDIADLEDFDRFVRAVQSRGERSLRDAVPRARTAAALTVRQRMDFVAETLRGRGWETVITRANDESGASLFVAAATDHPAELEGRWKLRFLFRAGEVAIPSTSPAETVVDVERTIADGLAGLFRMVVLLAAFGGALPDWLQKGACDLIFARPIGRVRLLLGTYAGAVVVVALANAAIFGACAIALGLRSGHCSPAFAGAALSATAGFAAVLPVALFVGVLTRQGPVAALAAIATFGAADWVGRMHGAAHANAVATDAGGSAVLEAAWWISPKIADLATLGQLRMGRFELSDLAFERFRQQLPAEPGVALTYGTTALFAAILLALTALLLHRRDL